EEIEYGLPTYEFIQQYLMWEEGAFSKSRDRGIFIDEAVEHYPADYWRFYLSKMLPTDHDTNFSWEDFESEINNVLNDTVGNFINRTLSLAEKWFNNEVPKADLESDREVVEEVKKELEDYIEAFEDHEPQEALDHSLQIARIGDRYLSEEEPWNNENRREETIYVALQLIQKLAVTLYPFIPESSEKIGGMLNTDIDTSEDRDLLSKDVLGAVEAGHELGEREILFEKIDVSDQVEKLEEEKEEEKDTMKEKFNEDTVSFDQFGEMDLRVGKVESVEEHPNADKLYRVKVSVEEAVLQTCAGLKKFYEPEELEDKKVVVLANLEPAELRGEKSECMMLAAESDDGETVSLLTTDQKMEVGDKIR
ncbi:MAG: hypothetical protein BRC26_00565, partial [Nanohaloarchaea archaeon QH_8_44_6]